jgi:hypothetical protein
MTGGPTEGRAPRVVVELLSATLGALLLVFAWRADRGWSEDHMTQFFCSTGPEELRQAGVLRWIAVTLGAATLLVARPRLGRWAARAGAAAALWACVRVGGAVLMALVVGDLGLRLVQKKPPPGKKECTDAPFYRRDPTYGWGHLPQATITCSVEGHTIDYTTNAFEARTRTKDDVTDTSRPTILFAGESIAWGDGVTYDEHYATLVGAYFGVQSVNYAVGNFAADQAHLRAQEALAKLAHPIAVVTLVVPVELPRALTREERRLVLTPTGAIEPGEPSPEFIRKSPLLKLLRALVPYQGDGAVDIARAALEATARAARARGAYPLVVFTPFNYGRPCEPGPDGQPRIAHRLLDGADLPVVSVDIDPAWSIDQHPDARGHRKIAEAIERALTQANAAFYDASRAK